MRIDQNLLVKSNSFHDDDIFRIRPSGFQFNHEKKERIEVTAGREKGIEVTIGVTRSGDTEEVNRDISMSSALIYCPSKERRERVFSKFDV